MGDSLAGSHEPYRESYGAPREWGVPPFEPLSIHTTDFDDVPIEDLPMSAHAASPQATFDLGLPTQSGALPSPAAPASSRPARSGPAPAQARRAPALAPADSTVPADSTASVDSTASADPSAPANLFAPAEPAVFAEPSVSAEPSVFVERSVPAESSASAEQSALADSPAPAPAAPPLASSSASAAGDQQHIISVRVCAAANARWTGSELLTVLESHGLAHGRYQVFHRRHSDGRTLFCAASLVEPGTFNLARMPLEEYRGLTLFAVLPGPVEPLRTLDALIETAGQLAQALHATLQDSAGRPLSHQRALALREAVAGFQARLTMQ